MLWSILCLTFVYIHVSVDSELSCMIIKITMEENEYLQPPCSSCSARLFEPYVECVECEFVNLCTNCFAKGVELSDHRNDHDYSIRNNDIPIFKNSDWPAKDEFLLLQAVSRFGYGNWDDISKMMQTYTSLQCREHYDHFYVNNVQYSELPKFTTWSTIRSDPPYLYRNHDNEDLPRDPESYVCQNLAKYNAYRSEFELNFDNQAEQLLNFEDIEDDEDKELSESLQCAVVTAYNNRLKERMRRYEIIRRHGLISLPKFSVWLRTHEHILGKPMCERMCAFMQLMPALQFDVFMENLSQESVTSINLYKLFDLRRNGVTTASGRRLFEMLKKKRENHLSQLKVCAVKYGEWKQLSEYTPNVPIINGDVQTRDIKRRMVAPLEIIGLPDYEKLNEKERQFCSTVRLFPSNFLEFRQTLINESDKRGSLRLCDARKLMKIDVNKTRKLYDMLVAEGLVKAS